jgi:hypothetical protein
MPRPESLGPQPHSHSTLDHHRICEGSRGGGRVSAQQREVGAHVVRRAHLHTWARANAPTWKVLSGNVLSGTVQSWTTRTCGPWQALVQLRPDIQTGRAHPTRPDGLTSGPDKAGTRALLRRRAGVRMHTHTHTRVCAHGAGSTSTKSSVDPTWPRLPSLRRSPT